MGTVVTSKFVTDFSTKSMKEDTNVKNLKLKNKIGAYRPIPMSQSNSFVVVPTRIVNNAKNEYYVYFLTKSVGNISLPYVPVAAKKYLKDDESVISVTTSLSRKFTSSSFDPKMISIDGSLRKIWDYYDKYYEIKVDKVIPNDNDTMYAVFNKDEIKEPFEYANEPNWNLKFNQCAVLVEWQGVGKIDLETLRTICVPYDASKVWSMK